jgi:hypothetical protein
MARRPGCCEPVRASAQKAGVREATDRQWVRCFNPIGLVAAETGPGGWSPLTASSFRRSPLSELGPGQERARAYRAVNSGAPELAKLIGKS